MRNLILRPKGISIIELLLAVAVAAMLIAGVNRLFTKVVRSQFTIMSSTKADLGARKALDRIYTELLNSVAIYGSQATILGNLAPMIPVNCANGSSRISAPSATFDEITSNQINTPMLFTIFGNGVSVLPGRDLSEVDPFNSFAVADPSQAIYYRTPTSIDEYWNGTSSVTVDNTVSDAVRIAYLPKDSYPIRVAATSGILNTAITLTSPGNLKVGDYAIISDTRSRELFRITGITNNNIEHSTASFWNLQFTKNFGPDATVQLVELSLYALDTAKKQLVRDNHRLDDGFDESNRTFTGGGARHTNWNVFANEVKRFQINFSVYDKEVDRGSSVYRLTRRPRGGPTAPEPRNDACKSQVAHPLFRQASIELEVAAQSSSNAHIAPLSRSISPSSMQNSIIFPPTYDSDPKLYSGDPTPIPPTPCALCPTPTPAPLSDYNKGGF